ncbi:family 10 glycosylhydrolase [Cronbergia sp. UHCC 0137]|uniref:family 10 glycosylhydrolase n=1 Tax=Cronbergia sp. UHCC 0137 TaxID=3110239 RepID=UPI002B219565|nr:family 10 glycosylhydrolase [Cronbergia sp. UHCC 0137]MEA5616398.1 family 10 glycosylhydrolase [Cronbergia sp. UHCC 0137]
MSNPSLTLLKHIFFRPSLRRSSKTLVAVAVSISLLISNFGSQPATAQANQYCQLSSKATEEKENLRLLALKGNKDAENRYQSLLQQHSKELEECRNRNWPKTQAIWLRLYPCDREKGEVAKIMDHIVNKGYNEVYLEAFYDGQVLLPTANNPTVWPSVVRTPGAEKVDLLAMGIEEGRKRGLKVYAWMFTVNFGYTYGRRADREQAIARNGKGQTSLYVVDDGSQVFVDPYNTQARTDIYRLVQEILRRRPDGVLFDYVRYPRQAGTDSISTKVKDLWLYSPATQEAFLRRGENLKGTELMRRFLLRGYITAGDINEVDKLYPQEDEPMWQGRIIPPPVEENVAQENSVEQKSVQQKPKLTAAQRQPTLQFELWQLAVAHAMQGILDFVALASYPAQQQGIPTGVVFFPEGNKVIGKGYDSRLQPWDRFPSTQEWHPMSYATCSSADCIATQVQSVLNAAKPDTKVIPALAGLWGKPISNRPPLEDQMQALRQFAPQINAVSHFAYSWQHPENDRDRKSCNIR